MALVPIVPKQNTSSEFPETLAKIYKEEKFL